MVFHLRSNISDGKRMIITLHSLITTRYVVIGAKWVYIVWSIFRNTVRNITYPNTWCSSWSCHLAVSQHARWHAGTRGTKRTWNTGSCQFAALFIPEGPPKVRILSGASSQLHSFLSNQRNSEYWTVTGSSFIHSWGTTESQNTGSCQVYSLMRDMRKPEYWVLPGRSFSHS